MSGLRTIVYVSAASPPMTEPQLEALLIKSRRLNRRNGITGILLYCDGDIMQCIEGPDEPLRETFTRIRASRLHRGIIELVDMPISERSFADWEMGYARPARSELVALSTARWESLNRSASGESTDAPGFQLLRDFWHRVRSRR